MQSQLTKQGLMAAAAAAVNAEIKLVSGQEEEPVPSLPDVDEQPARAFRRSFNHAADGW